MSRIKIDDLKKPERLTDDELRHVTGGGIVIQERNLTTQQTSPTSTMFNPKEYTIEKVARWT